MAQRSENGAWDKFDYARHLAATLAYLAQRQGDLPGLLMLMLLGLLILTAALARTGATDLVGRAPGPLAGFLDRLDTHVPAKGERTLTRETVAEKAEPEVVLGDPPIDIKEA